MPTPALDSAATAHLIEHPRTAPEAARGWFVAAMGLLVLGLLSLPFLGLVTATPWAARHLQQVDADAVWVSVSYTLIAVVIVVAVAHLRPYHPAAAVRHAVALEGEGMMATMPARLRTSVRIALEIEFDVRGFTVPLGASGLGKTTLLKALAGLLPSQGTPYMPQGYALFPHLRAWENVAYAYGGPLRRHCAQASERPAGVGLKDGAARPPHVLSGGSSGSLWQAPWPACRGPCCATSRPPRPTRSCFAARQAPRLGRAAPNS